MTDFTLSLRRGNGGKLLLTASTHRFLASCSEAKSRISRETETQINTRFQTALGSKELKHWGKSLNQSDPADKYLQK